MMSDEEKVGDNYIRHQPSFRSERLNRFILKLDHCLESTPSRHARHTRILGSPVEKTAPVRAKKWMIKPSENADNHEGEAENPPSNEESFELSDEEFETEMN